MLLRCFPLILTYSTDHRTAFWMNNIRLYRNKHRTKVTWSAQHQNEVVGHYITSEQHSHPAAVPLKVWPFIVVRQKIAGIDIKCVQVSRRNFVLFCIEAEFYFEVGYRRNYLLFILFLFFIKMLVICRRWLILDPLLEVIWCSNFLILCYYW